MSFVLGVPIPGSWSSVPLKHVTSALNRGSAPAYVDEGPVRTISQASNQRSGIAWARTRFHDFYGDPRKLKGYLRPQDILINSTGTGTLGRVGYYTGSPDGVPCIADSHVTVARAQPKDLNSRFAYYWLSSHPFQRYLNAALVVGATNQIELNNDRLGDTPVPLPPLKEQCRIADFLDFETRRIQQVEELRNKQLGLAEENNLANVFDVIRGAEYRDRCSHGSISWLGDTPSTWPVASVASQFRVQLGKMLNQERASGDRLRPYLRVANIQWDKVDVEDLLYMNFPMEERSRYEVLPGDLLICEGGSYPGRAAIWHGQIGEIYYQKSLHRARSRGRSLVRWLYYCLRIARHVGVFEADGNTSTITHLTGEQIAARRFPFPDPEVQERSVRHLDEVTSNGQKLQYAVNRQLALLAERRQALITAAVTGQIDVTTARGADVS